MYVYRCTYIYIYIYIYIYMCMCTDVFLNTKHSETSSLLLYESRWLDYSYESQTGIFI